MTGTEVDKIVRVDHDEFEMHGVDNTIIATCGKVVLSAGAIHTPSLVKRSPTMPTNMSNVGAGLADHYGIVVTAIFPTAPAEAAPDYWRHGLSTILGPDKQSQVIPVCFPRVSTNSSAPNAPPGPLVCAVITYGAMNPPRNGVVNADGTYSWGASLSQAHIDAYSIAFNATVDAMESLWGAGIYTMLEYPNAVFGSPRKTGENVDSQTIKSDLKTYVTTNGANQYHHLASMMDATSSNYELNNVPNVYVADSSVLDGWPGSPVAPVVAIGYAVGSLL